MAAADLASNAEGGIYQSWPLQEEGSNMAPTTTRLLNQEPEQACRRESEQDFDGAKPLPQTPLVEIHTGKPLRLKVKVHIPVKDHPNFNFVGKLLGPRGNSLKQLQEITQTKMAILGRGSMKDKQKEEELRLQDDPKYYHLREGLHVEITAFAAPAEAYQRIAGALTAVKRFLVPDYFDDIRQQQLRELGVLGGSKSKQKTVKNSSSESPAYESEDPTVLLETGTPTVPYPSATLQYCLPYGRSNTQAGPTNNTDDYRECSSLDSPYRTNPRHCFQQKMCNGICAGNEATPTNHDHMYESNAFNMYGNSYIQEDNTPRGNATYGDEIDITNTFEEMNDEQCVPPRRLFPTARASRSQAVFRSVKFRNHPYNSHTRYQ